MLQLFISVLIIGLCRWFLVFYVWVRMYSRLLLLIGLFWLLVISMWLLLLLKVMLRLVWVLWILVVRLLIWVEFMLVLMLMLLGLVLMLIILVFSLWNSSGVIWQVVLCVQFSIRCMLCRLNVCGMLVLQNLMQWLIVLWLCDVLFSFFDLMVVNGMFSVVLRVSLVVLLSFLFWVEKNLMLLLQCGLCEVLMMMLVFMFSVWVRNVIVGVGIGFSSCMLVLVVIRLVFSVVLNMQLEMWVFLLIIMIGWCLFWLCWVIRIWFRVLFRCSMKLVEIMFWLIWLWMLLVLKYLWFFIKLFLVLVDGLVLLVGWIGGCVVCGGCRFG